MLTEFIPLVIQINSYIIVFVTKKLQKHMRKNYKPPKVIHCPRITLKECEQSYNGRTLIYKQKNPSIHLYITPKGKHWETTKRINGKLSRIKLGAYPEIDIFDLESKILKENVTDNFRKGSTLREAIYGSPSLYTFSAHEIRDHIKDVCFLSTKRNSKSFKQIANWMNYLVHITKKDVFLNDLTTLQLIKHAENYHLKDNRSADQAHRMFNYWKTFFRWAKGRGLIEYNPIIDSTLGFDQLPNKREEIQPNTSDEIQRIFKYFPTNIKFPYGYLYPLTLLTGRRMTTLSKRKVSDIDWDNCIMHSSEEDEKGTKFTIDKNAVDLEIALSRYAIRLLKEMIEHEEHNSDWLFPQPTNKTKHIIVGRDGSNYHYLDNIKKLYKEISPLDRSTFNYRKCRPTFVTFGENLKISEEILQACMGHVGNKSVLKSHYSYTNRRKAKLEAVNRISDAYMGKISLEEKDLSDNRYSGVNVFPKPSLLNLTINQYNEANGKRIIIDFDEKTILKNYFPHEIVDSEGDPLEHLNYYTQAFFYQVESFMCFQIEHDLDTAYAILESYKIDDYIKAVAYFIINSNKIKIFNEIRKKSYLNYSVNYVKNFHKMYKYFKKNRPDRPNLFNGEEKTRKFRRFYPQFINYINQISFLKSLKKERKPRILCKNNTTNLIDEYFASKKMIDFEIEIIRTLIREDYTLNFDDNFDRYYVQYKQYIREGRELLENYKLKPPFRLNRFTRPSVSEDDKFSFELMDGSPFDKFMNINDKIYVSEQLIYDPDKPLNIFTEQIQDPINVKETHKKIHHNTFPMISNGS